MRSFELKKITNHYWIMQLKLNIVINDSIFSH
jgi:hypothetical protein